MKTNTITPNLTSKQERFCQEYMTDLNATQAAIRAGYSEKTAHSIGNENLMKPEIQSQIQRFKNERKEATGITANKVVDELAKIAFSPDEPRTSDRLKALELLGKHLGIFEKDNSQIKQEAPKINIIHLGNGIRIENASHINNSTAGLIE